MWEKNCKARQTTHDNIAHAPKATNTHSEDVLLIASYCKNVCMNLPRFYVTRKLPVFLIKYHSFGGARGGVVVKELSYKPAGCGFDSRWCHRNF